MGSRYLTDLASVMRGAGLVVQEESGWQSRSRSSGGYDSGKPNHVMVHHTASGASSDGQPDVNYMCYSSENRPVANIYLSRSGKVWAMAAGATNTNGSGRCPHCGTTDNMNTRAIGIEAGNNGTGETWPTAQQNAYTTLVKALCSHYGIPNAAVIAHFEYAPDRKIDPAGQSQWASGANKWNMVGFRQSCAGASGGGGGGGGGTPTEGHDVAVLLKSSNGNDAQRAATFAWNGVNLSWVTSDTQIAVGSITGIYVNNGQKLTNFDVAGLQDLIDRTWVGGPVPPGYTNPRYKGTGT